MTEQDCRVQKAREMIADLDRLITDIEASSDDETEDASPSSPSLADTIDTLCEVKDYIVAIEMMAKSLDHVERSALKSIAIVAEDRLSVAIAGLYELLESRKE